VNFETALADALHLNWAIPLAALPPLPAGLRYDQGGGGEAQGESHGYFSLVLLRQVGLHLRGASWLALSYPQVSARLCVRDAANTPSVLLLRQLVPGWVVPVGRLIGGQPLSAAVCDFPDGLPRARPPEAAADAQAERVWRWRFSAGARLAVAVELGAAAGAAPGAQAWEEDVSFFRDRPNSYWRQGDALRRLASEPQATAVLPVRARLEQTDWLETFLPFVPAAGWTAPHSAFLVPQVQAVFAFDSQREAPVAAPMAAAG
jgi:hypothetical protein